MEKLTHEQGAFLVTQARKYLESRLTGKDYTIANNSPWLKKRCGLFVTLHTHPGHDLRGCIGFTEPVHPLKEALKEASESAALNDPRFPGVTRKELDTLIIEISILTEPRPLICKDPGELLKKITPQKDGLILEASGFHGLFLPQVWTQLSEKTEFLENLCYKAGLFDRDAWQYKDTKIYRFRVQIFEETSPGGKIIEIKEYRK